jgi:hypothetical protein
MALQYRKMLFEQIHWHHARLIKKWQDTRLGALDGTPKECIISETDGSMIPIVKTKAIDSGQSDRRKGKELMYREARLTMAHEKNSVAPIFQRRLVA